jgi:hypothetical protein
VVKDVLFRLRDVQCNYQVKVQRENMVAQ